MFLIGLEIGSQGKIGLEIGSQGKMTFTNILIGVYYIGYNNVPFRFLNGLDIDSQGLVYFTDSSSKWDRRNYRYEVR